MGYTFSYNTSFFDSAQSCAKNYESHSSNLNSILSKMSNSVNTLPNAFDSSSYLDSINSSKKVISDSYNMSSILQDIRDLLDSNEDGLSKTTLSDETIELLYNNRGKTITIDNNLRKELGLDYGGTLYIPENFSLTNSLPMITKLHGMGGSDTSHGLGKALSNGYDCDAIVYCPSGWTNGNGYNASKLQENIETVANKLNANKDYMSITGFSLGGYAVYNILANNPDYYSSATIIGASTRAANAIRSTNDVLKNTSTKINIFVGSKDNLEGTSNYDNSLKDFEDMKNAGIDVNLYVIKGADHSTEANVCESADLINDMIYTKKGSTDLGTSSEAIVVDLEDAKSSSIVLNPSNNASTYYRKHSNSTVIDSSSNTNVSANIKNNVTYNDDAVNGATTSAINSKNSANTNTANVANSTSVANTVNNINTANSTSVSNSVNSINTANSTSVANTVNNINTANSTSVSNSVNSINTANSTSVANTVNNINTANSTSVSNTANSTSVANTNTTNGINRNTNINTSSNINETTKKIVSTTGSSYTDRLLAAETKKTYTLIVKYVYQANPLLTVYTETQNITEGDTYNIIPRQIQNYNTNPSVITGVMPSSNYEVLVSYVPTTKDSE